MQLRVPERIGACEIREEVDRDELSVLFRAFDTSSKRHVAVRVIRVETSGSDPSFERFRAEAARVAALPLHPNLIRTIEVGLQGALPFVVREWVEGRNLRRAVLDRPPSVTESLRLALQLAEGLEVIHDHGLVHRDILPEEVWLGDDGRPRWTELGLARLLVPPAVDQLLSPPLRSQRYLAPEQMASGSPASTAATNCHALGVMLYELLTGRCPFDAPTYPALRHQLCWAPPPAPRVPGKEIPRPAQAICLKALQKTPARRYRTASELRRELGRCLHGEPVEARTPFIFSTWLDRLRATPSFGTLALAVATGTLALLLLLLPLASSSGTSSASNGEPEHLTSPGPEPSEGSDTNGGTKAESGSGREGEEEGDHGDAEFQEEPATAAGWLERARAYAQKGRRQEAIEVLLLVGKRYPLSARVQQEAGRQLVALEAVEQGCAAMQRAIELEWETGRRAAWLYELAEVLEAAGREEEARQARRKADHLDR